MKNKKKCVIGIGVVIITYFVLSLCDFMYIPADKYPNIIRKVFFHNNKKVTVRSIGNVCQTKEGIYFLYEGSLMYMNSAGTEVKEINSDLKQIAGIISIEDDIFCILREKPGLYEIRANSNVDDVEEKRNVIEFISGEKNDRFYTDDKYIYCFSNGMLKKYTLDGRKIYSSKVFYKPRPMLGIGSTVFNGYSVCVSGYRNPYGDVGIDVPCHYIFNWNKVRYKQKRLGRVRYYSEASPWDLFDHYFSNQEDIEPYSAWTWKMDYIVRNDKSWWKEEIYDRNMEEYELVSIALYDLNPNYYRVLDGYIYFTQQLEITYRDKKYKDKIKIADSGISEDEKKEVEFTLNPQAMLRVKVEDIEMEKDRETFKYEIVSIQNNPEDFAENYEVSGNFIYSVASGFYSREDKYKTKVFITDINTGISNTIYTDVKLNEYTYTPGLYCSDNYVFLYQYKKEENVTLRIIRFDNDGTNPLLVMDEEGEVVMKPLEAE